MGNSHRYSASFPSRGPQDFFLSRGRRTRDEGREEEGMEGALVLDLYKGCDHLYTNISGVRRNFELVAFLVRTIKPRRKKTQQKERRGWKIDR